MSTVNFITKPKQNITEKRKKRLTKDNNEFGDNTSSKETKSNCKFKPKANDSISKNDKTANAKETVFILGAVWRRRLMVFYSRGMLIINTLLR